MSAEGRWQWTIVCMLAAVALSTLQARTWTTDAPGRAPKGEFVRVERSKVVIEQASGKLLEIPFSRLSDEDKTYIKAQLKSQVAKAISSDDSGGLEKITPPVRVRCLPIRGQGAERESGIEITNKGDRDIARMVARVLYLKADGSLEHGVPHTQAGFGEHSEYLEKGQTHAVRSYSVFMSDETAKIGATIVELVFRDGSKWPTPPKKAPAREGQEPVTAVVIGATGVAGRASAVVVCHNHSAKAVTSVHYLIESLDAAGKVISQTSSGHSDASGPLLPAEKTTVLVDLRIVPKGAIKARVKIQRIEFADGTKWKMAK